MSTLRVGLPSPFSFVFFLTFLSDGLQLVASALKFETRLPELASLRGCFFSFHRSTGLEHLAVSGPWVFSGWASRIGAETRVLLRAGQNEVSNRPSDQVAEAMGLRRIFYINLVPMTDWRKRNEKGAKASSKEFSFRRT